MGRFFTRVLSAGGQALLSQCACRSHNIWSDASHSFHLASDGRVFASGRQYRGLKFPQDGSWQHPVSPAQFAHASATSFHRSLSRFSVSSHCRGVGRPFAPFPPIPVCSVSAFTLHRVVAYSRLFLPSVLSSRQAHFHHTSTIRTTPTNPLPSGCFISTFVEVLTPYPPHNRLWSSAIL